MSGPTFFRFFQKLEFTEAQTSSSVTPPNLSAEEIHDNLVNLFAESDTEVEKVLDWIDVSVSLRLDWMDVSVSLRLDWMDVSVSLRLDWMDVSVSLRLDWIDVCFSL